LTADQEASVHDAEHTLLSDEKVPARSRARRFSAIGRRRRLPRYSGKLAVSLIWLSANVAAFIVGAFFTPAKNAVFLNQAYLNGIEIFTGHRLKVEPVAEVLLLAAVAACLRWLWLVYRVVFASGPIEVRQLDDASGLPEIDAHRLDVTFREYLTLPRLYQVTTIPGDREPEDFIAMFEVPVTSGWRGVFAAAYTYAFPRRAFIVSAALRYKERAPKYGVSVQVRTLLGPVEELETQWSSSFEKALERAAYAVGAYILPQTRRARNAPWAGWIGRDVPVSLFRNYQRAKRMVAERRYDEALALYRQALVQDAGNIAFRYDVGMLFERLTLYPDALRIYVRLVNEIFPPRRRGDHQMRRTSIPRWRAERSRDPYIIRYRYVVALGLGSRLAEELAWPRWDSVTSWLPEKYLNGADESRPWRALELRQLQVSLSHELSRLFPDRDNGTLELLDRVTSVATAPTEDHRADALRNVERYLLGCAIKEADLLIRDFRRWRMRRRITFRRNSRSALTLTAMKLARAIFVYRAGVLGDAKQDGTNPSASQAELSDPSEEEIQQILAKCHFDSRKSISWLEHYNAACFYALMLAGDREEDPGHKHYAYAAVQRLERALELGDEIAFVRTKRYWLQAGDPDLTGLRRYSVFREFEESTYGIPFEAGMDLGRFELYVHLRELLKRGAGQLEGVWRQRCGSIATGLDSDADTDRFEDWWMREEHAWEIAIRLGRFYRQWQTRQAALEALRSWIASFGREAPPVPYPNLSRIDYIPNFNELAEVDAVLKHTEEMLDFLGSHCGSLHGREDKDPKSVIDKARAWRHYAELRSRHFSDGEPPDAAAIAACAAMASVWAAVRQWAITPDDTHREAFMAAVNAIPLPSDKSFLKHGRRNRGRAFR
jgi:hypothetical protein